MGKGASAPFSLRIEMELLTIAYPARVWKAGIAEFTLASPANLRIQTTGADGEVLMNEGPSAGKSWSVVIRVEIVES